MSRIQFQVGDFTFQQQQFIERSVNLFAETSPVVGHRSRGGIYYHISDEDRTRLSREMAYAPLGTVRETRASLASRSFWMKTPSACTPTAPCKLS